jgi:hypothetical protein
VFGGTGNGVGKKTMRFDWKPEHPAQIRNTECDRKDKQFGCGEEPAMGLV